MQSGPPIQFQQLHDKEWLAERYQTKPLRAIAKEIGCCSTAVQKALIHFDIPRREARRGPHIQLRDREWLVQATATATVPDIAASLGVSPISVYRAAARLGVPLKRGKRRRVCVPA